MRYLYLLFSVGILLPTAAYTQSGLEDERKNNRPSSFSYQERGLPYIQNYTPEDYNAGPDNWTVAQSKEGIMYFGNKNGVLEYDGSSWRLIQLPNLGVVRSLAIDNDNRIYVGGYNDIGFLAPDSVGQMQFVSLKDRLDPSLRDFQNVWRTHIHQSEVYFQASKYLMRWNNNEFKVLQTNSEFGISKILNDSLFIIEVGTGLMKLVSDTLQTVLSNAEFQNARIFGLAPSGSNQILVLTLRNGLYLFNKDNPSLTPFSTPVDAYLKENWGYNLKQLPNGWYSIATIRGGLVVIDESGNLVHILNETHGLSNNSIYNQFVGRQHALWLATNGSISRVELLSPYTIFDERLGIDGFVNMIHRHEDVLYVANDQGILRQEKTGSPTTVNRFKYIENTNQGFDFLSIGKSLFAAANSGVYEIIDDEIINTFDYRGGSLFRSRSDTNQLFIGLFDGLASLKRVNGRWREDGVIQGVKDDIREIVEDKEGNLWLESQIDGVWRVKFSGANGEEDIHNPSVKHFKANRELPKGILFLHSIKGEPVFEINGYVYRYNAEMDSIKIDDSFVESLGLTGEIAPKIEDRHGNLWMYAQLDTTIEKKPRVVAILEKDGSYTLKKISDERISQKVRKVLYPEDDGILWYGGTDGIIRHNTNIKVNTDPDFKPLVRKVTADSDSLIFGGAVGEKRGISLPYTSNNLRFEFAAPSYDDESANQFQFYLENFDEDWSAWTSEVQRDYTNIPEGTYTFRLRAKNIYGTVSLAEVFSFEILPPFYRTWWAYGLYVLLFAGFTMSIVKWRSRKLQQEKEALQKMVAERTRQVEEQAEQLKELDEAKSRFFANISHEFRTPLTLILGQVEQLESTSLTDDPKPIYRMIKRNGQRVLDLVNQLLDLSTLESGKMKLQAEKIELISFLKPIVAAYDSLAESTGIVFSFNSPEDSIPVYLDRDKMEKVMQNVISNAFKFTGKGGKVAVSVAEVEIEGKKYVQIQVKDSGKGIPPGQLDKIFDRFYKADDSNTKSSEGSGIGLALAKELVTLHKGTISVKSEVGKGSCFTISLHMEKEHLSDDEIIDSTTSAYKGKAEGFVEDQTPQQGAITALGGETTTEDSADARDLPQILVVEDNADMRQYIHQILHTHYQVAEASDGSEGCEKAVTMIPDLVISDVMMPEMDGLELCRRLKKDERTSHIPVILLTAKAGKASKLEGLETRADDYLTKPFDANELLVVLRNRIEQRAQLRARFSREVTVQPKDIAITSADERFLRKAMDIVENNMDDFDFNVQAFVEQMHLEHTQVNRKLKALTDFTPVQFIRFLRLKRAAKKIARQEDTISQIAYSVGFNNLSYFAKCFKEQFGSLPSDYSGDPESLS
jgi:signal transduction histidine kinase/CheY-like chemotaxis protein